MRPNRLRELIDADQPSLGTHILSTWPSVIELVGNSGNCASPLHPFHPTSEAGRLHARCHSPLTLGPLPADDYVEFVGEYAPCAPL